MFIVTTKEIPMIKQLILSLTLMLLLLSGCTTTAQDAPQAFPPDVLNPVLPLLRVAE